MTTCAERPWLKHYDPWVTPEIDIPDKTYADLLEEGLSFAPERPAVYFFGKALTFSELDRLSARFAEFLTSRGYGPGDVVGIHLVNVPQYLIALAGSLRAGCAVSGLSFLLTPNEMAHQLNDSGARLLVTTDASFEEKLAGISDRLFALKDVVVTSIGDFLPPVKRALGKLLKKIPSGKVYPIPGKQVFHLNQILKRYSGRFEKPTLTPEDVCLIQYTGGTTGLPKGTLLTHQNIVANVTQARQWTRLNPEEHDIGLSAFPFFHLAGLILGMMALSSSATQCLIPDPRDTGHICKQIQKYHPTLLANVPTLYQMLLAEPAFHRLDFSACRLCISGAAPFAEDAITALESVVGKGKVMEVYGMTETSPLLTMNPFAGKKKIGTVGIPIQSTQVKLVDLETGTQEVSVGEAGEVIARGPQVMAGYKDKPEETDHALREFGGEKWLFTGDVAVMDADGYFTIVDRTKDMVNVGGYKVFSREVEEVLYQHKQIAFCAIIGRSNPERPGSERVVAVIQPAGDFHKVDKSVFEKEVLDFCRKTLAPYKVPRVVEFVEAIPLTSVGKVDKKALR